MKAYLLALRNPDMMPTALRVAFIVGTLLFSINHGSAALQGKMSRARWFSAIITYAVPYCVNIHGQLSSQRKHQKQSQQYSNSKQRVLS
jgi:hypothetical protein